ncbi:MAG: hypothetical protein KZQ58_05260 [gamma proteobacterium symbiont of Bathyaustriella thionipta]|nr:hypothetical protein [gamma proteobacterium symbiont of Bathyaustriella thionipta]
MTHQKARQLLILSLLLSFFAGVIQAAESTTAAKALIPWDAEGRVYRISVDTVLFQGDLEGILYLQTSQGEFDEGFVRCPAAQELNTKTGNTHASGNCMITVDGGDTAFAEWTCHGKIGHCKGQFKLTGGSGRLEGLTGSSSFMIRSPMRLLAIDKPSDSAISISSGLAILPDLKYSIPAK